MASIAELFPKCRKLAYDARQRLAQAQLPAGGSNGDAVSELQLVLDELNHQLDQMEGLAGREAPEQRQVWRRKIAELRSEGQALSQQGAALQSHQSSNWHHHHTAAYQSQRDELLAPRRRRPPRDLHNSESDLQNLTGEASSLQSSNTMVLDLLATGEASRESLQQQRDRLRGVTRVVFDIGTALGLSQSTMRVIERRDVTDAYLVAAGMVVTLIVLYLTWFHFD